MGVELLSFYYEGYVREFFAIGIVPNALLKTGLASSYKLKLRAWIGIKNVDVFKIVLTIASSNDEEPAIHNGL